MTLSLRERMENKLKDAFASTEVQVIDESAQACRSYRA